MTTYQSVGQMYGMGGNPTCQGRLFTRQDSAGPAQAMRHDAKPTCVPKRQLRHQMP